jgi:hypothetical protein
MLDLFISFVSSDEILAKDLADSLEQNSVTTMFTKFNLGDSLSHRIEMSLREAEYGVVILSQSFFKKPWSRRDLDKVANIDREYEGKTQILPIWHEVTQQDIARYSNALANRVGVPTKYGLEQIVEEILEVVKPSPISISKGYASESYSKQTAQIGSSMNDLKVLQNVLVNHFDMAELKDLAFDLSIDYENIPGTTKSSTARELILYCQRRGRLNELVAGIQHRRPHLNL